MANSNWGSLHCSFIQSFFSLLNSNNIRYFLLRNYETLPEYNNAKDVDIVIEPGKYNLVRSIIINTMHSYDIPYYTINKFDRMRCWYIMDNTKHFSIHIDIIENEVYKGYEYFDFDFLYSKVIHYKNFYALSPAYDTAMLLIQNIVAYKNLKPKYCKIIDQNFMNYHEDITAILIDFWGAKTGNKIITDIANSDFEKIISYAHLLERTAKRRIFCRRPFYTIKNIIRFLSEKFIQIIICPRSRRKFIAIEAPDGTGKTTFINELVKELSFYYNSEKNRFNVHHFRPNFLPNLGAAGEKVGIMKQDTDFNKPHRALPANKFSSFLRMIYYLSDYLIGVPYILRKESQYGGYTIFDRYIYDFLIDPYRSRINLPYTLRLFFVKLVISPRIIFLLNATPEIVYKRKQELEIDEIRRQMQDYIELKKINNNCEIINADNTPSEMVSNAIAIIMNKFMNRVK